MNTYEYSDYDIKRARAIVEDGEGDWFNAMLMRYIASLRSLTERAEFGKVFNDVHVHVADYFTPNAYTPSLWVLAAKADNDNRRRIATALRSIANHIDP